MDRDQYASIDIGSAFVVRFSEHGHDTQKNLLHTLDWRPSLGAGLIMIRIIAGGM
jgi:hypothetical protein